MTTDERNMLTDLANKVAQTQPPPKDQEAEDFIRTRIGNRPDALYIMTQTVLIQNLALQQAQQQIQTLQQRSSQPVPASSSGSFLGQPSQPRPSGGGAPYASSGGYSQQQGYQQPPPYQQTAPTSMPSGGGAGGFLRGAAQTAAGVAAGALAFEGIESLFHGFGQGGGGFGSGFGGFGGSGAGLNRPVEETVNNYYDSPGGDRGGRDDLPADNLQAADDGPIYADDTTNVDDSNQFDNSNDTGGGFDDSGDNFA